jgi:uncharacterized membrane-anchored protein
VVVTNNHIKQLKAGSIGRTLLVLSGFLLYFLAFIWTFLVPTTVNPGIIYCIFLVAVGAGSIAYLVIETEKT